MPNAYQFIEKILFSNDLPGRDALFTDYFGPLCLVAGEEGSLVVGAPDGEPTAALVTFVETNEPI